MSFSSSSGRGGGTRPHDIKTQSELTSLYNQPVVRAERVVRPLGGSLGKVGVPHSGVVVTTQGGDQWLVHKGGGYGGKGGDTVVTHSRHMSDQWVRTGGKDIHGSNVSDFVKSGGKHYNFATDNCHDASRRMMNNK